MYCPHCGNQTAAQSSFCSSCGAATAPYAPGSGQTRLFRPLHPRMIAGVCSGAAIHFGWDVAVVRIVLVVITCLTSGCGILFYIAAWILIPQVAFAAPDMTNVVNPQNMDPRATA